MIYSQKSPKMGELIRDFHWELDRFVVYRSQLTKLKNQIKKSILGLGLAKVLAFDGLPAQRGRLEHVKSTVKLSFFHFYWRVKCI
jgi:hypothetical protein